MIATALTIAGSDPSGGAGIQADLKTFSARGVYGMSVITALTAQNTRGVTAIHLPPADFVRAQIDAVFTDIRVNAVKIGMLANAVIATEVAAALEKHAGATPIVLDPVMVAKGGSRLLEDDAIDAVTRKLVPLATLITPNLPEAAAMLDCEEAATREVMEAHAHRLLALGAKAVLLKGGHLEGAGSPDLLLAEGRAYWMDAKRILTENTHGTGCTLSAAIAAELAQSSSLPQAVESAKAYLTGAIAHADSLQIGEGHGPTHHFFETWPQEDDR